MIITDYGSERREHVFMIHISWESMSENPICRGRMLSHTFSPRDQCYQITVLTFSPNISVIGTAFVTYPSASLLWTYIIRTFRPWLLMWVHRTYSWWGKKSDLYIFYIFISKYLVRINFLQIYLNVALQICCFSEHSYQQFMEGMCRKSSIETGKNTSKVNTFKN